MITATDCISIFALAVSIIAFGYSMYEKKIKLDAYLNLGYLRADIDIYNNSSRKVTIPYFKIYSAKHKYFSKRRFAHTWFDDNDIPKYVIHPYESTTIQFIEAYNLDDFIKNSKGKHVYISLFVSRKKVKTVRLI